MTPPKTIDIKSDGNILEYIGKVTPIGTKVTFYQYRYIKSFTKLGTVVGYTETDLEQLLKINS